MDPCDPQRSSLAFVGTFTAKFAATDLSVTNSKGFSIAEFVLIPSSALTHEFAENGITVMPLSLYEMCSALTVTMPLSGLVII